MSQLKLFDQTEPRLDELERNRWRPIEAIVAEFAQLESQRPDPDPTDPPKDGA